MLCHKDLDVAALVGTAAAPRMRFGHMVRRATASDPRDEFFAALPAGNEPAMHCPSATMPEDLSCMFCTSGTTARPKIVVYDHAAYWLSGSRHWNSWG